MRIRTQLILAAFVLAVIPLAAIVTWSYHSSRLALESAYRRETQRTTRQMDRRLTAIRADLDQRLSVVSALPMPEGSTGEAVGDIVSVMGESAALVDALEFHPIALPPKPEAAKEPKKPVKEKPEVRIAVKIAETSETPEPGHAHRGEATAAVPQTPAVASVHPVPPSMPIVIDIPAVAQVQRFAMSEKQRELIQTLSTFGPMLSNPNLSPEQREDVQAEMRAVEKELRGMFAEDRKRRDTDLRTMQRAIQVERERSVRGSNPRVAAAVVPAPPAPAPEPERAAVKGPVEPSSAKPAPTAATKAKSEADAEKLARKTSLIFGRKFAAPVSREGELVGQMTAKIRPEQVIQRVLGTGRRDDDEVPFAIDREGTVYARTGEERERVEKMGIVAGLKSGNSYRTPDGWMVSSTTDPQSGLKIGVARPVGENFDELRKTAARNFVFGMGLIAFALIGIVPLSNHLARDVRIVTDGADRIAHGDLMTRLPVKSNNELGQLARAFNRMAADLSANQQQLLEQERAHKEQELQQRLLEVEYERKSFELEEARRFQLSMLPKEIPQFESYEIAVYTRTATEVGGDYYDFHHGDDVLSITIGDATGHGAKAGTMVTVIKTLFAGYDGKTAPASFLADSAEKIKRMDLGRMAMSLSLAKLQKRRMTLASAGMPPALVHRAASGSIEEIALAATPLGTLGTEYAEKSIELEDGDTVLFMSDGFPELFNHEGQQLGYVGTQEAFAVAAREATAEGVIAALTERVRTWHGDAPPNDDVTFVVLRSAAVNPRSTVPPSIQAASEAQAAE